MFAKTALAAAALSAVAAAIPYAEVGNGTPNTIYFQLVDASGVITTSDIAPQSAHEINLGAQVSMKMSFSQDLSEPYQFEFNYDPSTGFTYYDFSAIDCHDKCPDFYQYPRSITPSNGSCQVISCAAGDSSNDCQYTTSTNFGAPGCQGTGSNQATLNVVIGTPSGQPPTGPIGARSVEFHA